MIWIAAFLFWFVIVALPRRASAKDGTVLYTSEEIENARRNVRRYDWAEAELDDLLRSCQPWIKRSDNEIWEMVTGQSILRGIHVNRDLGCPSCGRDITNRYGNYPWIVSIDRPWKLECPSCGEVFPKNDFEAFRRSGLGPGGTFHRDRADESLLRNADSPGASGRERGYGVDDGQGWIDQDGNRWFFVPYYAHWCIWSELPDAARDLGEAYLRTGDPAYAHKGAVLLDRMADVYPETDLTPCTDLGLHNSHGGSGKGRVKGCIWETGLSETLSRAYDMIYEGMAADSDLVRVLTEKARTWEIQTDKSSIAAIRSNIETGLLREFINSCRDRRIRGNEGSTHKAMAAAAVVLDDHEETPAALAWLFQPGDVFEGGGHIPATLIGQVDRDGVGNEAAPGYCFGWMRNFRECVGILERCRKFGGRDLYREFPRLKRMLAAPYRLTALDQYTPGIGDSGQTGNPGMVAVTVENAVDALRRFGDPYFAQLAHKLNGDRVEGLHTSVFDAAPEAIQYDIREVVDSEGALDLGSANLNGYGLATFRSGTGDARRAVWLYYGRNGGHGHKDRLNLGMFYRGMDILPDLGYPEYANADWPKNRGWTKNTISHNTVQVDQKAQEVSWIGQCAYFSASGDIGVVEVASPDVYPGTQDYRRTLAVIDLSETESYLVDIFRVEGGTDHVLSFHAGEGEVTVDGLEMVGQQGGTYASPEIPFGTHYDGPVGGDYMGSGFAYLYDVFRASEVWGGWRADWSLDDTWGTRTGDAPVHVRYHAMSPVDEAALAFGDPPQNKPGNPRRLQYLLQHNKGESRRSLFASVIEPYSGDAPNLSSVDRLDLGLSDDDLTAAAVRVVSADSRTDLILSSDDPDHLFKLGDGVGAAGRFVMVSLEKGRLISAYLLGGIRLEVPDGSLEVARRAYTGVVSDMHREETGPAWIDVRGDLPAGTALNGAQLRVHNDGARDACYTVEEVVERPNGTLRVDLGDTTFVRGLASDQDYSRGYVTNFESGDTLDVQTVVHLRFDEAEPVVVQATAGFSWNPA